MADVNEPWRAGYEPGVTPPPAPYAPVPERAAPVPPPRVAGPEVNPYAFVPGPDMANRGPYNGGYPPPGGSAWSDRQEGERAANLALILAIVGLFTFPLILGPLALWQAHVADGHGVPATLPRILGWVQIVASILGGVLFFLFFLPLALVGA